jgi:hypothetical protein
VRLILLHTPKGGSGKSTLARELAVAMMLAGHKTALVDLDPQGTTTGWYGRRDAPEPVLIEGKGGVPDLAGAEAAGIAMLVVDTPPATPAFLPALIPKASVVLVPVRPSPAGRGTNRLQPCWACGLGFRAGASADALPAHDGGCSPARRTRPLGSSHDWLPSRLPRRCD